MNIDNTGWKRALSFLLPYLLISMIFQFIGSLIAGIEPSELEAVKSSFQELIIVSFDLIGVFAALWLFTVKADKERLLILGFQTRHIFREFGIGFGIGALAISSGYFLLLGLNAIQYENILIDPLEILTSTVLFLFVSISEEAVFRGYVLRNLLISFHKYTALIISAILFAALHLINPFINLMGAISLICAGLLYGIAYIYTKKLWLPIALHFSWNLVQTLMGFNVSGHDQYSLVEFQLSGNHLINGGSFGFEGSVVSVGIQGVIILVFVMYSSKNKPNDRSYGT